LFPVVNMEDSLPAEAPEAAELCRLLRRSDDLGIAARKLTGFSLLLPFMPHWTRRFTVIALRASE
jgi:hypothetical protein